MILSFYIARRFLRMTARVTLIFVGILLLIDLLDQLRRFSGRVSFGQAMELAVLHVPSSLYTILPLIFVLAAIALFLGLARSSELVVMRAAGRAGLRVLAAPVITAFLLGVLIVAVLNPLVAATSNRYEEVSARLSRDEAQFLSVLGEGLWLRQGSAEGQTVIHAEEANANGSYLRDVTMMVFDANGQLTERIAATEGRLGNGEWTLRDAKRWALNDPTPEATAVTEPSMTVPSELTSETIRAGFREPSEIAFWKLPQYIHGLETAGFQARDHRVWFQSEMSLPFFLAAMVLIAAGFTMRHARQGGTGSKVMLALLVAFVVFFLRNFAQVLGENGQIPVILAAWIPSLAAVLASLGLLLHLEDG
ncbi:LPS export ABC transporter permease LptG [Falsirhodobacter halotolerans]|uniref:LPS export ABC transporter permease LptG n=1 Tax=Falsirhodobacter halotolerans TaxID=1146892 RepID=UPI001FD2DADE|nr:LPS export ABC transporter permease LptG [Falsirhodobacter halotolerans]MCJ8139764.1 LPS export ABC transporter permease LptG [Falsirhodobacter halotolerans]